VPKKKRAFQEWESSAPGLQDCRFMRLSNSQMLHPKMQELSGNAFKLYCCMKLEADGNLIFEFPHAVYTRFMAARTFLRAKDELIAAGFIEVEQPGANLRAPNKYRFSARWKAP
jgi:hypothetical protein